jgi:hypothetical protein
MRISLLLGILLILVVPNTVSGQDRATIKKLVASHCQDSIFEIREMANADSLSRDEAEKAYQNAVDYYRRDTDKGCGSPGRFESQYLRDVILNAENPDYVQFFVKYLKITSSSSAENLSTDFEKIFVRFPEEVIEISESKNEQQMETLAFHVYWGYLNNTYPESRTEPVNKFWVRYEELGQANLKDSPFLQKVIERIEERQ